MVISFQLVGQVFWLVLPVVVGGLVHIAVIRLGLWPALAQVPLDGGATFRGRRIFGDKKTLRGALAMVLATVACALVQASLFRAHGWARSLSLIDFDRVSPLLWGFLLGLGYIAGELPNSFAKRQLGIPPGAAASGRVGVLFWVLDQSDSLFGALLLMCIVWVPPLPVVALLVVITFLVHPAMALLMLGLGLKTRVG